MLVGVTGSGRRAVIRAAAQAGRDAVPNPAADKRAVLARRRAALEAGVREAAARHAATLAGRDSLAATLQQALAGARASAEATSGRS